jgi:luciferase family oxidoreductase group 1
MPVAMTSSPLPCQPIKMRENPCMTDSLTLSVLDQSPAAQDKTQDVAIRESIALAQRCDALGYFRYWVSEHHNSASIVGSAPEVLMAAIAATTRRIRVGSAGVMLPHYSAYKVAEQFRVLEAIAPGRIDLGVGRAPGSDRLTAMALNPDLGLAERFPNQVQELDLWLRGELLPEGHPFRQVRANPQGPSWPQIWILGSSDYGARLAAHFGLPYAYAYFFTDGRGTEEALALYRQGFRSTSEQPQARATICVWALAAQTETEAWHLLKSREHWRVGFERGLRTPLLAPEVAEAYPYTTADRTIIERLRERAIVGTGEQVAAKLRTIAASFDLDEIVINTWTHDPAARIRSYELIAAAFESV